MVAFSSSFISSLSRNPKTILSTTTTTPPSRCKSLQNISSLKIDEKSHTRPLKKQSPSRITQKHSRIVREPSLFTSIFNAVDEFINTFIDPPSRQSIDPKHVLSKNFAPVLSELPPTECEVVEGSLPPALDGAYIRNGPNPQFLPRGPYHLFDGDGMLHCIRIHQGKATLSSRYVKTNKFMVEHEAGSAVYPNVFSAFNGGLIASAARGALSAARIITGQYNPSNGIGLANTSVALFGGNLFALGESDLPYIVKISPDGDVITLNRHDFDGKLTKSMTAHPKIDPDTGETFAFKYSPIPPFLTYFRINPDGEKHPDVPIFSVTRPSLLHDFAITKKYAIFADTQIGMNPIEMISGGSPVSVDQLKVPRIGVIPRYAEDESEMRWFEVSGLNMIHATNAWEEENETTIVIIGPNTLSIEHTLEHMELTHAAMEIIKIDLDTGTVWRQPLSTRNLDFSVINPAYISKKNKYVYSGVGAPLPKIGGVVKLDLSISEAERRDCIVASRMYEAGCYGGEPFFVAKDSNNPQADEDDGYIITYMHNENNGESRFLVMDAKSPNLEIVAIVKLPRRVPYGFHGLFVKETDLNLL